MSIYESRDIHFSVERLDFFALAYWKYSRRRRNIFKILIFFAYDENFADHVINLYCLNIMLAS